MRLTWLCALRLGSPSFSPFRQPVLYYICTCSSLFPPPSASLLPAGTEEDVVYPGKLPHCLCREFPLGDGTAGTRPARRGEKLTVEIPARLWRGLGRLRWDLMPGVSRPSPGTAGDEGDRDNKRGTIERRDADTRRGSGRASEGGCRQQQTEELGCNKRHLS